MALTEQEELELLELEEEEVKSTQKVQQPIQEQPQQKASPIARVLRSIMKTSPMNQMRTASFMLENAPEHLQGETVEEYNKRFSEAVNPKLQEREEQIASQEKIVGQFGDVMNAGLFLGGMVNTLPTIKMVGKFQVLEKLLDMVGVNKKIEEIPNTTVRDLVDTGKFVLEGVVATERWTRPKTVKSLETEFDVNTEKSLGRIGVKPSGEKSFGNIRKFYKDASSAMKSIYKMKDQLQYTHPDGTQSTGLPKNLYEFSQAIPQVKSMIYQAYHSAVTQATGKGVILDNKRTANAIVEAVSSKEKDILDPKIQNYAIELANRIEKSGPITPEVAEKLIQEANVKLNNYDRTRTEELRTMAGVEGEMAKDLRLQLDELISKEPGVQYQQWKNQYGQLRAIEPHINRILLRTKDKTGGIVDWVDLLGSGEILGGILTGNFGLAAKGAVLKGGAKYFKNLKEPNNIVNKLFEQLDFVEGQKQIIGKKVDYMNRENLIRSLLKLKKEKSIK